MEASLRTAYEELTGFEPPSLDFTFVRGTKGIKEAVYKIGNLDISVAAVSGLANARKILNSIKNGEKNYHFIEIMACPGGCINGGGQPVVGAATRNFVDLKTLRAKGLYELDQNKSLRKAHENPVLKKIYEEFLEHPGSDLAHKMLHTDFVKRRR